MTSYNNIPTQIYILFSSIVHFIQIPDKDLPYYHELRSKDSMEAMKRIQQVASMLVWSHDVHGIVKMSDTPRKTLYRSKTENPKPQRKKTPIHVTPSLPLHALSTEVTGMPKSIMNHEGRVQVNFASNETLTTNVDDDISYGVVSDK